MQNVLWGFLWRWAQELGGFGVILASLYAGLSPSMQADVQAIATGHGGGLSISAVVGLLIYAWGRWQAFRATTMAQVVTSDGTKVAPKKGSAVEGQIDAVVVGVKPQSLRPTLWDRLTGLLGRK